MWEWRCPNCGKAIAGDSLRLGRLPAPGALQHHHGTGECDRVKKAGTVARDHGR